MPSKKPSSSTHETSTENVFKKAFDATAEARAALTPELLMPINIDVRQAHNTALGVIPKLAALRSRVAKLSEFDMDVYDSIETYAQALAYAHPMYLGAAPQSDELPELAAHAMALRDRLLGDATMLARRNLVDAKRLAQVQGGNGYLNIASDLATIVGVIRDSWAKVQGKSPIDESELAEADELYRRMTMATVNRTQASETEASWANERQRAYTLLIKAYEQARRAATFLLWPPAEADKLVPSLWKGRGGRPSSKSDPNVEPADPVAPVDADPAPVPAPVVAPSGPGMPGGSPFL